MRRLVSLLAIALVAGCSLAPAKPQQSAGAPNKQLPESTIAAIAARVKGRVGVFAIELETNKVVASYHAGDHFPMQSVYKLPICMTVIKQIDAGSIRLDQRVPITKQDYIGNQGHSPIRDQNPNGTELTVKELIRFAISESDGTASDVLMKLAGGPTAVQSFLSGLGIKDLVVLDTEKALLEDTSRQYRNYSSPKAAVDLLRALQEKQGLSEAGQQLLLQNMVQSSPGARRLKGLLPAGTIVAHKTGTSGTERGITAATNDIGIITLPNGNHLGIAVFVSDSSADNATRERAIAQLAKLAFDFAKK